MEWGAEEGDDKTVGALHHLIEPGITMQPSGGCLPVQQYFNSRRPRGLLCVASQRIYANRGSDGSDGWLWGRGRTLRKEMLVMRARCVC